MARLCEGRIVAISGAGRGLGRAYALELARRGARLVINDLGGSSSGEGADVSAAQAVVDEIIAAGGEAVASTHDISDWEEAEAFIDLAISTFGHLDVLVNNAGILRDRTLVSMTAQEWDDVVRVHLRGTAATSRFAAGHWRARSKEIAGSVGGRLINTTSASGIYGSFGQTNYGAAKAGIASLTIIAAKELERYGVTANAIAPEARTRLTEALMPEGFTGADPAEVAPVVAWLASGRSADVTGRVFDVGSGRVSVAESWRRGPEVVKTDGFWNADELDDVISGLLVEAAPNPDISGRIPTKAH
jgi:NAD(P)-dependent dehydrogenase (short-subunit alcohol dehydrogenase family)